MLAHVGHHELDAIGDLAERLLAPVKPVEHAHVVAAVEQPLHENASDVAAAARDQDALGLTRVFVRQPIPAGCRDPARASAAGLTFHGPTR